MSLRAPRIMADEHYHTPDAILSAMRRALVWVPFLAACDAVRPPAPSPAPAPPRPPATATVAVPAPIDTNEAVDRVDPQYLAEEAEVRAWLADAIVQTDDFVGVDR